MKYDGQKVSRIRADKCYLVQLLDEEGNEIKSEYVFTRSKENALDYAKDILLDEEDEDA